MIKFDGASCIAYMSRYKQVTKDARPTEASPSLSAYLPCIIQAFHNKVHILCRFQVSKANINFIWLHMKIIP